MTGSCLPFFMLFRNLEENSRLFASTAAVVILTFLQNAVSIKVMRLYYIIREESV